MKKKSIPIIIFLAAVFIFFLIWFSAIHPIVVFDTDDWAYSYWHREAYPIWGHWNPARVFPEVFMPIITSIGAWLIYPLSGDYCGALTLSYAVAVSAAITMLFAAIYVNLLLIHQNSGSPVTNILPLYLFLFATSGYSVQQGKIMIICSKPLMRVLIFIMSYLIS